MAQLDRYDIQILKELQADARLDDEAVRGLLRAVVPEYRPA